MGQSLSLIPEGPGKKENVNTEGIPSDAFLTGFLSDLGGASLGPYADGTMTARMCL